MRQSNLFTKTLKQVPKDEVSLNAQLLIRAGFVHKEIAGVYSFLPLGLKVLEKIKNIIRDELNKAGGQEIVMTALQDKEEWLKTDRWSDEVVDNWFKTKLKNETEIGLAFSHEEPITKIMTNYVSSYKDLPFYAYQFQNKFRNELRPTAGLLRTREFVMKDMYSFHSSIQDLDTYYLKVIKAYKRIYRRCGLEPIVVNASSGTIGGNMSNEFMILAESGEDNLLFCKKCGWAANVEVGSQESFCPKCNSKLTIKTGIEVGHIFKLGSVYSQKMKAFFVDQKGRQQPLISGCYGIGLERLMATIIELNHDKGGIIWPANVSPFDVHLLGLGLDDKIILRRAQEVYKKLKLSGFDVLFDDRSESAGVKFNDSDLIGIPIRLVVSRKSGSKIEYKKRCQKGSKLFTFKQLLGKMELGT